VGLPPSVVLAGEQTPAGVVASPLGGAGVLSLPGKALSGTVADITGDGLREIVRLVPLSGDEAYLAVEAWREHDGGWQRYAAQPVVRRGVLRDAPHTWWQTPDRDGMVRLRADEPARLVSWSDGQRERLLVAAVGATGLELPCCLAIHEVAVEQGELRLALLEADAGSASELHALDMNGDGADELIVLAPVNGGDAGQARVFRWSGERFTLVDEIHLPPERSGGIVMETDGRPGFELLLSGRGPAPVAGGRAWSLLRLTLEGGALKREQARAPVVVGPGLVSPGVAEPGMLITDFDGTVRLARWPADERLVSEVRSAVRGYPLAVLGQGGAESRVLLLEGSLLTDGRERQPILRVLDDQLQPVQRVRSSAAALEFRAVSGSVDQDSPRGPWPYVGELPGGLPDGRAAFIFNGQLIAEAPGGCEAECLSVEPVAPLPGMAPIGVAGHDGRWLALAHTERAFGDVRRRGGSLASPMRTAEAWRVAPTAMLLGAGPGRIEMSHQGAADHPALPGVMLSSSEGFRTELVAPPGSWLYVVAGGAVDGPRPVGDAGRLVLSMPPPIVVDEAGPAMVRLLLVTPAGVGLVGSVEIAMLHGAPELEIEVGEPAFSPAVPLSGRVSAIATLTIDGRRVALEPDGRFSVEVSAGPWPRRVEAMAVDPFGAVTQESFTVIGLVDYRRLPWPGIVLALTIAAAMVFYLRTPRARRRGPASDDEPGSLEELPVDR
jgi:hypothetical protein